MSEFAKAAWDAERIELKRYIALLESTICALKEHLGKCPVEVCDRHCEEEDE